MGFFWGPCVCSQVQNPEKSLTWPGARGKAATRGLRCRLPDLGLIQDGCETSGLLLALSVRVFMRTGRLSCWQTPAMPCITQQTDSGVQHELVVQVDEQAFPAGQTPSPGPHVLPLAHAESRVP